MSVEKPETSAWPEAALVRVATSATPAELSRKLDALAQLWAQCPPDHLGFEAMLELGYRPHPHVEACAWCRKFRGTLHGSLEQWQRSQRWDMRFRRWLYRALHRLVGA